MNLSFSGKEAGRGCFGWLFWLFVLFFVLCFILFNAGFCCCLYCSMPVPSVDENSR